MINNNTSKKGGSARKNPFTYTQMTEPFAYILGVYIAGCGIEKIISSNGSISYVLKCFSKERELPDKFRDCCIALLQSQVNDVKQRSDGYEFGFTSYDFCTFILDITNSRTKIPDAQYVPRTKNNITCSFLEGFLDSKGFVSRDKNEWGFGGVSTLVPEIADLIKIQGSILHNPGREILPSGKIRFSYSGKIEELIKGDLRFNIQYKQDRIDKYGVYKTQRILQKQRDSKDKIKSLVEEKEEIEKSKQLRKKQSILRAKVLNDEKYKNLILGIDYVICKMCSIKMKQLDKHIQFIHKISVNCYLDTHSNALLTCSSISDKIKKQRERFNPMNNPEIRKKLSQTQQRLAYQTSQRVKQDFASGKRVVHRNVGFARGGIRSDLGHYVRSTWEANFARVLKFKNIEYQYESHKFTLKEQDGSIFCTYIPDFYIPSKNVFIEVKGALSERAQKIFSLMKVQYPEINIIILSEKEYRSLKNDYDNNISWEETGTSYSYEEATEFYLKIQSILV